jgi:hypothetical protein
LRFGVMIAAGWPIFIEGALALWLVACAPTPVATSAVAPGVPDSGLVSAAAVESVRAYLRAFKMNEKDLPVGLTIPWAAAGNIVGTARATGKMGPQGHQVYEVTDLAGLTAPGVMASEVHWLHEFVEIAPE